MCLILKDYSGRGLNILYMGRKEELDGSYYQFMKLYPLLAAM